MANKTEIANLNIRSFVDTASRYNSSKILYYGDRRFITFETYKKKSIPVSDNDRFYIISKGTEYRPDLVSMKAYGTVSYWWKILEANNMKDIYEFKSGTNIIIPNVLL